MTTLRQRMTENMQLRGLKTTTQQSYLCSVTQLATYYHRSPDQLSDDEIRHYFLYLINERKLASKTVKVKLNGIYFLYKHTLYRELPVLDFIRPAKCKKLPTVLAIEEVKLLLQCVTQPIHRMCLYTIYCCGLRISEAISLQLNAIDSKRHALKVIQGKGGVDRLVALPQSLIQHLRYYWATERPPAENDYLFPGRNLKRPLNASSLQKTIKLATAASGINKDICVHTLRHSYATNLLELGVDLRIIQNALGHKSITTTSNYAHLTPKTTERFVEALDIITAIL